MLCDLNRNPISLKSCSPPPPPPATGCPGRWAWLMPQTAVETFRVGQKPGAYRASRAQGSGDSRGQISQMPRTNLRSTPSPPPPHKNWTGTEPGWASMQSCRKFSDHMKRIFEVCQSWVLHLDRLHPCLLTLPPSSLYLKVRPKLNRDKLIV